MEMLRVGLFYKNRILSNILSICVMHIDHVTLHSPEHYTIIMKVKMS